MNNNLIARASITINASAERVWDALVNPEAIKQYMFGTNVATDWREGSPITWKGEWQGKSYEDKGVILRFEPPRVLQYSHFSPLSGLPDKSENYHTVTIELSGEGHQTRVSLSQDNNATEEARKHSEKMWGMMLEELKKFVEQAMNKQIKEQLPIGYWLKRADKLLTQRIDDAQRSNGLSRLAWQTLNIIFQRGTVMRDDIVSTLQTFANHATIDGVIGELVV